MALEIINRKIVGTIDNLENKLEGTLPVTREELLVLVNFWGRLGNFYAKASNNQILMIDKCEAKECYDLSKLDTSEITDMSSIFRTSNFNGDISNWNVSNVTNMGYMFYNAKSFKEKYNSGEPLPTNTDDIKEWLNDNRYRMNDLSIKDKYGKEIDDFFSNITDIYSTNRIGLHEKESKKIQEKVIKWL